VAIEFYDDFFRFGAIFSLLWNVYLLARFFPRVIQARLAIVAALGQVCFLIVSVYDEVAIFGTFSVVLIFISELNLGLTWLLCLSVFKDNFAIRWPHWFVLSLYAASALLYIFGARFDPAMALLYRFLRLVIYGYLIFVIVNGHKGDLIERRRSFRFWFVGAIIAATAFISIAEVYYANFYDLGYGSVSQAIIVFIISVGMLVHITRANESVLFAISPVQQNVGPSINADTDDLTIEDQHSLRALEKMMASGIYKETGLTISTLSDHLHMPEHRLRRLINHHLGHRNFSQYLNDYRITEAKRRLKIINDRHIPILTISMDLGYQSLGPFNRAFKNRTGMTPSEYRKTKLKNNS
jgi:AraC-like DNA-binding protein